MDLEKKNLSALRRAQVLENSKDRLVKITSLASSSSTPIKAAPALASSPAVASSPPKAFPNPNEELVGLLTQDSVEPLLSSTKDLFSGHPSLGTGLPGSPFESLSSSIPLLGPLSGLLSSSVKSPEQQSLQSADLVSRFVSGLLVGGCFGSALSKGFFANYPLFLIWIFIWTGFLLIKAVLFRLSLGANAQGGGIKAYSYALRPFSLVKDLAALVFFSSLVFRLA